ncbi:MAG: NAD(P)H-dependent oxidoreductase, partial [bacterium]|nr:NAD(P)H-dependent oxidoreductase [bacterium]
TFPGQEELGEKLKRADGYVVVSPEYNHSFSGELKLFLDAFYQEYARKPVGICGVSVGPNGGVRAVEQLRLVFIEFHAVPIREAVYFRNVADLFDEQGAIKDASYEKIVKTFFDELIWFANALKAARS